MSDSEPIESIVTRKRRKWSARILLFLLWSTLMALLCSALLVAGSYLLYRNRTGVVNRLLAEIAGSRVVQVGGIDVMTPGGVTVEDVRFRLGVEGGSYLEVPKLRIGYQWPDRRKKPRVESLDLIDATVVLGDDFLEMLASPSAAKKGAAPATTSVSLDRVRIDGARLKTAFTGIPNLEFDFSLAGESVRLGGAGEISPEPLQFSLANLVFGRESAAPYFELPALAIAMRPSDLFRSGTIEPLHVNGLAINLTPESLAAMQAFAGAFRKSPSAEGEPALAPEPAPDPKTKVIANGDAAAKAGWTLGGLRLEDGRFSLRGFAPPAATVVLPDIEFGFDGEFSNLVMTGSRRSSGEMQQLRLHDVIIDGSTTEGAAALARIETVALEFEIDTLLRDRMIEKLHIDEPVIEVARDTIARFLPAEKDAGAALPAPPVEEDAPANEEGGARGKAYVVRDFEVRGGLLTVDPKELQDRVPVASAAFELATRGDEGEYRLQFKELRLRNPEIDAEDFGKVALIDIDFSAAGVQRDQTIDRIGVQGFNMTIGKELQKLMAANEKTGAVEAVPGEPKSGKAPLEGWKIGEIDIKKSTVTVRDVLPDFPAITFGVQTMETLKDLTVGSGEGKASHLKQRFEIVNLEIASKYNPSIPVADLRTIWIEFTLGGLLKREIDRVEIGSPDIYVGEHLFWYIDYQRNLQAGKAGGDGGEALLTATGPGGEAAAEALATEVIDSGGKGWTIKKIDAYNGRLIFAPKGVPVGFNPFPFSVSTNLEMGEIDLQLEVPTGTYTFPNMELELEGLQGTAQFNVPIKQKDNNLVQTFSMGKLRFRKYEADDVWLTITYDKAGIYTNFGGQAYEGYLNGGFNVYVGDEYGWDAWVSGADIAMKPLTEAAAPENFLMEGRVNGEIIAGGMQKDVATLHGVLQTLSEGSFQVTKLNEFLERLPPEWTQLQRTLTQIGVSRLRDFDFAEGVGRAEYRNLRVPLVNELKLPYYEREVEFTREEPKGIVTLGLKGETGSRSIEMIYHDRRGEGRSNTSALNASNP